MTTKSTKPLTIWCLLDGKAGHENQQVGFAEAIQRRTPCEIHRVSLAGWDRGVWSLFRRDFSQFPSADPDLIFGAGHATHVPLGVLRRRFGGRTVVLMKPSLPLSCFDLCLIPDVHDLKRVPANTILTKGVLNRIVPSGNKDAAYGLVLVGGPSAHHKWSGESIFRQATEVVRNEPDRNWKIVTSRRTPDAFCELVRKQLTEAQLVLPHDVDADWLPAELTRAATVWVSADSVSMTYEALTSGAEVGVLELERFRSNRVTACIDTLIDSGDVVYWSRWKKTRRLNERDARFCEAERCAAELLARFTEGGKEHWRREAA